MTAPLLQPFLDKRGYLLIDGGLSTQLEAQGHDLNHALWTARLLEDNPAALRRAHRAFLEAGADCVLTSSYQATAQGLVQQGFSPDRARELLLLSVELAREAAREPELLQARQGEDRPAPLVAASLGPYGAYLADGSEYRGNYGMGTGALLDFHRERLELLAPRVDLLAIETLPSLPEALALRELLGQHRETPAWISFSCPEGTLLADGTPLKEAIEPFLDLPHVLAVGVNCTRPGYILPLIETIRCTWTEGEVVVYPNSGEEYCATSKTWKPGGPGTDLDPRAWLAAGARLIGGCCRVAASDLARLGDDLAS